MRRPQSPLPPASRLAAVTVLAALLLTLASCGRSRAPGGAGRFTHDPDTVPLLVLEGTAYEMGWWYGHLLKDTILERASVARRTEPQDFIEVMADAALMRITERTRQELDGMAAATGLEVMDLLRAEVMTEALRYRGAQATLPGMAGLLPTADGFEARMQFGGTGAAAFARDVLLVHRKPTGRAESVSLSRRGSLGAWAYLTTDGHGFVVAEVEIANRDRKGFGAGRPYELIAREALDAASDVEGWAADLKGSMGHTGLGFAYSPSGRPRVRGMAGVQVYGAPDLPWALGEQPFLAVGPYEDPESPQAKTLQEQLVVPRDLTPEERWLRMTSLDDLGLPADASRPTVTLKGVGPQLTFTFSAGPEARSVALELAR